MLVEDYPSSKQKTLSQLKSHPSACPTLYGTDLAKPF